MGLTYTAYIVFGIVEDIGLLNRRTKMVPREERRCPEGHPDMATPHCPQCGKRFETRTVNRPSRTHISEVYPRDHAFEGGGEVVLGVLVRQIDTRVEAGAWPLGVSGVMVNEVKALLRALDREKEQPCLHLVMEIR